MSGPTNRFGQSLRIWRLSQDMEQQDLAKAVGVSRQVISLWEIGKHLPGPRKLEKLRQLMGPHFPTVYDAPPIPIEAVLDAAKAALDAWWLEYRAQVLAAAYNTAPDAPPLPDGSGHIEATAARELLSRSAAPPAPNAQDAAPTRRRK